MEIAQLILEIVIILIGFYLAFFKSYFSEHGKQLALKEHVEELTRKVENIKSEIDLLTRTKFDLATNERTAILDYHSKYYDWRNSVLNLYPSVINEGNFNSKEEFFNEVHTKELMYSNSGERLSLFNSSTELRDLKLNTTLGCMEIHHHAEKYFELTAHQYVMFHYLKKQSPMEKHLDIQNTHHEKTSKIFAAFRSEKLELLKELVKHENLLNEHLRKQLFKDIK